MQNIFLGVGMAVGLPLIIAFGVNAIRNLKSAHAQNLFALGGQVAREAVLLAEEEGLHFTGEGKLTNAVDTYIAKMAAAGFSVTVDNAHARVQAAHTEMTLDKTTAYNEKPSTMTLDTAAEAMPGAAQ